jgi:adenylylsulfate kinase-like enzyme
MNKEKPEETKIKRKGITLWFTGITSSGKTIISNSLKENIEKFCKNKVVILEGDQLRKGLNSYFENNKVI